MGPEELETIKALAKAATPGPWHASIDEPPAGGHYPVTAENGDDIADFLTNNPLARQNAAFVAHAREKVPAMVAEVERLRAGIEKAIAACETCGSQGITLDYDGEPNEDNCPDCAPLRRLMR
jgi:hypothetical protein